MQTWPQGSLLSTYPIKLAWTVQYIKELSVPECDIFEVVSALGAGMKCSPGYT